MNANLMSALLRAPSEIVERCRRSDSLREITGISLACLVCGAALFGGVVGSFRGGAQIAYAALKLPLALLTTLVVSVPAFFALAVVLGGQYTFRSMTTLTLAAAARGALVLAACAPVLWLAVDRGLGYHASVLLSAGMYLVAGLAALELLVRGLGSWWRSIVTSALCGVVFLAVLGQTAWMLRPFLGRPAQQAVPFVRQREGSFADSLAQSSKSAAGIYKAVDAARLDVKRDPGPSDDARSVP